MQYLIRFTQWHETFRLAEIRAIAYLYGIDLKIISYSDEVRTGHDNGVRVQHLLTSFSRPTV